MKKLITFLLCAVMALSIAACGAQTDKPTNAPENEGPIIGGDTATLDSGNNPTGSDDVEIPNPFVDCDTIEAAGNLAGFYMTVPSNIDGYEERYIQVIENQMIQLQFTKENDNITIRKGAGNDDVSGDYTTYATEESIEVNGVQVSAKGNDGVVHLATWVNDNYAYSVMVTAGTDINSMTEIVKAVK